MSVKGFDIDGRITGEKSMRGTVRNLNKEIRDE
jgi:hypothetical protein